MEFGREKGEKHAILEDDGLHVSAVHEPLQVGQQDHEGLQVQPHQNGIFDSIKYSHWTENASRSYDEKIARAPNKRKRALHVLGAGVVGIIIILGAVLGSIFGGRAAKDTNNAAPSSSNPPSTSPPTSSPISPSTSPTQGVGRIRSQSGAWNGTGLASSIVLDGSSINGVLIYQDYTGAVIQQTWEFPANGTPSFQYEPFKTNITAANGTAFAMGMYIFPGYNILHMVYVSPNGELSDAFISADAFIDNGLFNGGWQEGNLATHSFKVPLDNRPALHLQTLGSGLGKTYDSSGARLWVGGLDGGLYQLSFDLPSHQWNWSSPALQIGSGESAAWGYGGVSVQTGNPSGGNFDLTLYTTTRDGTMQYQTQMYQNNDTDWPDGPQFLGAVDSNAKAAPNSSIFVNWSPFEMSYIFYPSNAGFMGTQEFNTSRDGNEFTGLPAVQLQQSINIMPGTDMTEWGANGLNLVFYQETGSDISWISLNGNATNCSGKIVPNSTGS